MAAYFLGPNTTEQCNVAKFELQDFLAFWQLIISGEDVTIFQRYSVGASGRVQHIYEPVNECMPEEESRV